MRAEPYQDLGVTALNILPPGQGKYLNALELALAQGAGEQPSQNTDQVEMYDSLIQGYQNLQPGRLQRYFKEASFGVPRQRVTRQYSPREGVTILRDQFQVPHVYGATRADTMFGSGYVSAEDRLFMMDVLRHVGRARISQFLGASPENLAMDRAQFAFADYTEDELLAMQKRLVRIDPVLGGQVIEDIQYYTAGINQYIDEALLDPTKLPGEYEALQVVPEPWLPTDTAAAASLIVASLGAGGGSELRNAAFLDAIEEEGYSPAEARRIFDDLRFAEDPEAPVTADGRFPWNNDLGPVDRSSVARPDDAADVLASIPARPTTITGPFGPIRLGFPDGASNALLVGSKLSESGRPLAVFGPQTGYWSPEILMEIDMHGPGIHARGAAFPGLSLYVLLGRGDGYAWSATSAGGDQVDVYAVELCNPAGGRPAADSTSYVNAAGKCEAMEIREESYVAKPSAGGQPDPAQAPGNIMVELRSERTDFGLVRARGTIRGKPVAFTALRSSYGGEVDSALTYVEILDPRRINGPKDFQRAFGRFSSTFNWFYVDGQHIAYQLGGYHPLRADGVDPDLPVWGRSKWRWRGLLSFQDTPKAIDPAKGYITSWNNKQAHGFRANDGQWSYGPVYRSQPLDDRIIAAARDDRKVDLIELVQAMEDAATVDLRGDKVLPFMLRVIGMPKDAGLRRVVDLLWKWHRTGAHRADLAKPFNGEYDHAAAVGVMDEWWSRALESVFKPVLGKAFDDMPISHHNPPGPVGSSMQTGWYGQIQKDLRTILGLPVKGKFSRIYCGNGSLARCRQALEKSLNAAVSELDAQFGPNPKAWGADEEGDRIQFVTLGVQGQDSMQWQNRPTFQQVVEFRSPGPGRKASSR